jgi:hypothetical protein
MQPNPYHLMSQRTQAVDDLLLVAIFEFEKEIDNPWSGFVMLLAHGGTYLGCTRYLSRRAAASVGH